MGESHRGVMLILSSRLWCSSVLIWPFVPGCRHWDQVRDEVQREFDQESESFTLEQIVELGMDQHVEKIGEISASATRALALELVRQSPFPWSLIS